MDTTDKLFRSFHSAQHFHLFSQFNVSIRRCGGLLVVFGRFVLIAFERMWYDFCITGEGGGGGEEQQFNAFGRLIWVACFFFLFCLFSIFLRVTGADRAHEFVCLPLCSLFQLCSSSGSGSVLVLVLVLVFVPTIKSKWHAILILFFFLSLPWLLLLQ